MQRDPRMQNASAAIVKLADECAEGGVEASAIGLEIAIGLRNFLDAKLPPGAAAATLREMARQLEHGAQQRPASAVGLGEQLDVADRGDQFIRTLVLAGVDEGTAITGLHNACILAVARTRGAEAAADWLKRIAKHTRKNAASIDQVARNR